MYAVQELRHGEWHTVNTWPTTGLAWDWIEIFGDEDAIYRVEWLYTQKQETN